MMSNHLQLTDDEFEWQFQTTELKPQLFSHEAHLRLAWIHINKYGLNKACKNLSLQIKKFDAIHDNGTKYHQTITIAAIKIVHHFILKCNATEFSKFISQHPPLVTNFKDLLHHHYSPTCLQSDKAKGDSIPPDKQPFD